MPIDPTVDVKDFDGNRRTVGTTPALTANGGIPVDLVAAGDAGAGAPALAAGAQGIIGWERKIVDTILALAAQIPATLGAKVPDASLPVVHAPAIITRCSFADSGAGLLTPEMVQVGATGAGITVAQSGGNLNVTTGTNVNAEFLARSLVTVQGAFINRSKVVLSQRIAQQNVCLFLADLVGSGLAFTTDATGLVVTVTKVAHGFTAAQVGQAIHVGGVQGIATAVPGRMIITGIVDADNFTISPTFACTWTRSTTTATVTFVGGNPIFALNEGATVSASSDTAAIVNGAVTLLTQTSGGVTTFTCLNAGATSGTLTLAMSAKAWTPSAAGTLTLFGYNAYSVVLNNTGSNWWDTQRRGWASGASSVSVATLTSPGALLHIQGDGTMGALQNRSPVFATTSTMGQSGDRVENLPNDDVPLYLWIQVFNGVTAPASSTTVTFGMWSLEKLGNIKFHIAGGSQTGPASAVQVKHNDPMSITGTLTVNATTSSSAPTLNTETTTVLAASATYTGASRDGGATAVHQMFCARAFADQAGTLRVEMSTDNATWRRATADIAVAANGVGEVNIRALTRYHRVIFVNGATLQTAFLVTSAYHKV